MMFPHFCLFLGLVETAVLLYFLLMGSHAFCLHKKKKERKKEIEASTVLLSSESTFIKSSGWSFMLLKQITAD